MRFTHRFVHIGGYSLGEDLQCPALDSKCEPIEAKYGDKENVWWGEFGGRIPMGLWVARMFDANIIWSTGASFRARDRMSEAQAMYEMAKDRYYDLNGQFPNTFPKRMWRSEQAYLAWLRRVSSFETTSTNTSESMTYLREMVDEAVGNRENAIIYLVTSANHLPRTMVEAMKKFGIGSGSMKRQRITLCGMPAQSCYGGKSVSDVVVRDIGT